MRKVINYSLIIIFVLVVCAIAIKSVANIIKKENEATSDQDIPTPATSLTPTIIATLVPTANPIKTTPTPLPDSASVKMSFTSQAPFANWDALHEDSCEEASLIMVYHFYKGNSVGSKQDAENQIQTLVSWEANQGYGNSITANQLKDVASSYFSMKTGRIGVATIDNIKKEIAAGRPVIIPAAGRILPNPNFTAPGPIYHMLVIKGYDNDEFITNDPGTRQGEGFKYTYDSLINAIHDWNGENTPESILQGKKLYLVFD